MEIKPCPMCGSRAEVYATGTSECYGYAWQRYGVACTSEKDKHCDMTVSIDADFSFLDANDDMVIQLWNTVADSRNSD